MHSTKERKPWMVEAAGSIFDRPPSLRDLKEGCARYFIAVAPDVEKRVLAEGFRVKRRCSIPCSATPQEALAAFSRTEQRQGRSPNADAKVLAVTLPQDALTDVIRHREGGFLIRRTELSPGCFSRIKRL